MSALSAPATIQGLFITLDNHLRQEGITVLELFTISGENSGSIRAFELSTVLELENIFSEEEISKIIANIPLQNDGFISSQTLEMMLRRVRWGKPVISQTFTKSVDTITLDSPRRNSKSKRKEEDFSAAQIVAAEVQLRENIMGLIITQQLYRTSDLKELFRHVIEHTPPGMEVGTQRVLESLRVEMKMYK